ncbi:T9SS type A sorting domain-containing protein, partial [bacterium]|nr:T9SS type A sorting domain-containing protein [bacterium]
LMVMYYYDAYGDTSLFRYGDSCANFVADSILPLDTEYPLYNLVHCFVTAFVSGALAEYGEFRGDDFLIERAESLGIRAKNFAEENPDTALGMEIWAMSPGTVIWGILRSYFSHHSDELNDWISEYIDIYVPDMAEPATTFDPYIWDNAWNVWYANGYRALAGFTGDSSWFAKYINLVNYLLAQDTDMDGGIPASAAHGDTMDMSWITTYLVFMGIEGVWDSLYSYDVGASKLFFIDDSMPFHTADDTLHLVFSVANFGNDSVPDVNITITCENDTIFESADSFPIGYSHCETLSWSPDTAGTLKILLDVHSDCDYFPDDDTISMSIFITPIRAVSGHLIGFSGDTTCGKIEFYTMFDSTAPYATIETDSIHRTFYASLPEITYRLRIEPEFPNPVIWRDSVNISAISGDWNILLPAPDILLVQDDGGDYGEYFSAPMESIGVKFSIWNRERGELTSDIVAPFQMKTILWFTGDVETSTLTSDDKNFLADFIDGGGKLILTGQYIAEDISGSDFWNDYISADVCGSGEATYLHDIWGIHKIVATAGNGSALNQVSIDWMVPPDDAEIWIVKNLLETDTNVVAFGRNFYGSGKILFSSLGFEGIGKIGVSTLQETRKELFQKFVEWFDTAAISDENLEKMPQNISISAFPNPFNDRCLIAIRSGENIGTMEILDIRGNLVYRQNRDGTRTNFVWKPDENTSSGIFFIRVNCRENNAFSKIIYLK